MQQLFTQLHTDYTFAYSSHPNCVLTAITKNLCKRQGAIDKEVRARATKCRLHARRGWQCSARGARRSLTAREIRGRVREQLARSQELAMSDIPQGSGPSTASMVEPY